MFFNVTFIGLLSLVLLALPVRAESLPLEKVMPAGSNCLRDYQGGYQSRGSHKAFAFAIDPLDGRQRCAWSYGQADKAAAQREALGECDKEPIGVPCRVVDTDGRWSASAGHFTALAAPSDNALPAAQASAVMATAQPLVQGKCVRFLEQYLGDAGHKVFAYWVDQAGVHACGKAIGQPTAQAAEAAALAACERGRGPVSRQPQGSGCRTLAVGNRLVLGAADYGVEIKAPPLHELTDDQYKAFVTKAEYLLGDSCLFDFKRYVRQPGHKAFFHVPEKAGKSACAMTSKAFTATAAESAARANCESIVRQRRVAGECRLFARDNDIVATVADLGIAPGIDEFRHALSRAAIARISDFVGQGMDIETASADGVTPLLAAAMRADLQAYKAFLARGASTTRTLDDGSNLLLVAATAESVPIVRDALTRGLSVNAKGVEGNTALHVAVMRVNPYLAKLLVDAGADPDMKNDAGKSPRELLAVLKVDIDQLAGRIVLRDASRNNDLPGLREIFAKLPAADRQGALDDALLAVQPHGSEAVFAFLADNGADLEQPDRIGNTLLMNAALSGRASMVRLLLSRGADKARKSASGQTALDLAKTDEVRGLLR